MEQELCGCVRFNPALCGLVVDYESIACSIILLGVYLGPGKHTRWGISVKNCALTATKASCSQLKGTITVHGLIIKRVRMHSPHNVKLCTE